MTSDQHMAEAVAANGLLLPLGRGFAVECRKDEYLLLHRCDLVEEALQREHKAASALGIDVAALEDMRVEPFVMPGSGRCFIFVNRDE